MSEHQDYIDTWLDPQITKLTNDKTHLESVLSFFNQFDTNTVTMAELQTAVDSSSITDFRANWIDEFISADDDDTRARAFITNQITYLNENISAHTTELSGLSTKKTMYEEIEAGTWTPPAE